MVVDEHVEAGRVAAPHLEPVERRQRDLHRGERLDRRWSRDVRPQRSATARAVRSRSRRDRPDRVLQPHERGVHVFELDGRQVGGIRVQRRLDRGRSRAAAARSGARRRRTGARSPRRARTPGGPFRRASTSSTWAATRAISWSAPPTVPTVARVATACSRSSRRWAPSGGIRPLDRRRTATMPHIRHPRLGRRRRVARPPAPQEPEPVTATIQGLVWSTALRAANYAECNIEEREPE